MRVLAVALCLLTVLAGCSKPQPTQLQKELVEQLTTAPPKTILVGRDDSIDRPLAMFDIVCSVHGDRITVARVSEWSCGSDNAKVVGTGSILSLVMRDNIYKVVEPKDSGYPVLLKRMAPLLNDLKRAGRPTDL